MLDGLSDYLHRRQQELGLERADVLTKVQVWLDERYPDQARAVSLNKGVLMVDVSNAPLASELRLQQRQITALSPDIVSLRLSIGMKARD